jgi:hypothetical protein
MWLWRLAIGSVVRRLHLPGGLPLITTIPLHRNLLDGCPFLAATSRRGLPRCSEMGFTGKYQPRLFWNMCNGDFFR